MALRDIVRERTRHLRDAIDLLESQIGGLRQERTAREAEARNRYSEADLLDSSRAEKNRTLESMRVRVDELQRQFEHLRTRLDQARLDLGSTDGEIRELVSQQKSIRKDAKSAEEKCDELKDQIDQKHEEKRSKERSVIKEKRLSLLVYNEEVWQRFLESRTSREEIEERIRTRTEFERARNSDPQTATLYEAWTGWREIIQSDAPSLVKETAQKELQRIQKEIESAFPGALDAMERHFGSDDIQEIYYRSADNGRGVEILLPVPAVVWGQLQDAAPQDNASDVAMHLFWSIIKGLPLVPDEATFDMRGDLCVLSCSLSPDEVDKVTSVSLSLAPESKTDLIISRLEKDIEEATHEYDSAS